MIKEYERELNELQEGKLISKEDLHEGDEIIYNGEHYFVTRTDTGTDFVWITDDESERYNRNAQGWTLKAGWIDEVIGQPEEDELDESLKEDYEKKHNKFKIMNESSASRYADTDAQEESIKAIENTLNSLGIKVHYGTKIGKYPQTVILDINYQDNAIYIMPDGKVLINGDDEGKINPKDKEAVKQMMIDYGFIDTVINESWKDFAFIVKCNDGPKELIRVIAEDRSKAEEYAKKMYAQNHTTYADDRHNIWSIDEDLSSDIDKVKHAVDQFKGQVTVSKDSGNDVREYLLSKNISFMIDDSKSAKGKLTFMLKYPIPKLLNKNENLSGNMTVADIAKKHDESLNGSNAKKIHRFETDNLTESKEDTQYGVHSFSQSSIIFRGTEEECAEFIADHNLWDDAEIYAMTPDDLHYLKESEEDGLENATQEYTSANTSINSAKLPAIFSMVNFKPETINLDYGGGKFDNATTALEGKGVTNLIYDPYNRSSGHNKDVIDTVRKNGGADTVTCSNVLNVIKEPEARKAVIKNIYSLLKNSGTAYFTVYEGTGKGNAGPTKLGYQLNKKTGDYVEEISAVFPSVSRHGKLIIASKGTSITEEFDDDWSDTLETGGEPTYCPDCGVRFVREEGDAVCPKCNKTPYQLANERRKNESLNEDDIKYTATGRKKMVSDETMYRAVEAAKTVDPNAKSDYDDDFIYGDDGHGGSTWVILLNGDGKAYSTWGRNAVLTSKVEKAVNDAADAYWADFDKRWEENNKHLAGKKMKESALNETYYAVIEVDGKERRFPFNNRDTAKEYIAKAQRGELPEFKGKKIGSTYTEALNVVREEVKPNIESKGRSVNESLDFTNAADVRHRLDSYSGQYLTVTFRGSYDWKYISDLLEEYNDGDEEEADLALDKLEAVYGSEYKLLKALEVDEISEITAMDRGVLVTIKVDKDDLYHNYADLINNPSIKKDTVKILELELNESLKKRYKKFSLKESTSKEKTIKEDLAVNGEETLVDTASKPAVKPAVIIIKVESSISADGFEVTVKGTDGSIIDQRSFRYGYNAAYSRLGVDKYRPFVTDIINRYLSKYNLNKDNIIVTKGRNAFKGTDVSDEAVADFKTKYLGSHLDESKNESLKENYGKDIKNLQ